jgi:hypothetical protein
MFKLLNGTIYKEDRPLTQEEVLAELLFFNRPQMRLYEFIKALEAEDPDKPLRFHDGKPVCHFDSWRGSYEYLAISDDRSLRSVGAVLEDARKAVGGTFYGYKGGTYKMDSMTRLWRSNCGDADDVIIVGVKDGVVYSRYEEYCG